MEKLRMLGSKILYECVIKFAINSVSDTLLHIVITWNSAVITNCSQGTKVFLDTCLSVFIKIGLYNSSTT